MDSKQEFNDKKNVSKGKPHNSGPPMKLRSEPTKRRSFNLNEAVMSLDMALGRLKKTKLVSSEYGPPSVSSGQRGTPPSDMFQDLASPPSMNINQGLPNSSLMSMNLSHYELMRNVSRSTSNSDGAYSGNTCTTCCSTCCTDNNLKDERLEKYFRSVEMWNRKYKEGPNVHFEIPEK